MVAAVKEIVQPSEALNGAGDAGQPLRRLFTLEEFARIAQSLPDEKLELINGEILMSPPPDFTHIEQTMNVEHLLAKHLKEIEKLGCRVMGTSAWYAVPVDLKDVWVKTGVKGPDHICPDVSVCYSDYLRTNRRPPALLVVEVISISHRSEIDRDLISKPDIYASLEIPAYWVVDRRDQSVWAHTAPQDGKYTRRTQYKGRRKLPAPGMEFLHITPAQIFTR